MKPNAKNWNQAQGKNPEAIKALIKSTGLSQLAVCEQIGIPISTLRDWLNPKHKSRMPYTVQFCIEAMEAKKCDAKEQADI